MLFLIYRLFTRIPVMGRILLRKWYQLLAKWVQNEEWGFMNYGYAEKNVKTPLLKLNPSLEPERYGIQLYNRIASTVNLKDKIILEIGCGRGKGAAYIYHFLKPKALIGIDFASNAVDLCNRVHGQNNLTFQVGDAEALPFDNHSYDVIINVESAHCYASILTFLREVSRVLRPGGHFLFADLGSQKYLNALNRYAGKNGLELLVEEDITRNVLDAMELDYRRKLNFLNHMVPRFIAKLAIDFIGAPKSRVWCKLDSGKYRYLYAAFQKRQR